MIDLGKLKPILEGYKVCFPSHWDDEKYKWEAIKHFQDHWNMDAENFGDMFKQAIDKAFNPKFYETLGIVVNSRSLVD